MNELDKVQACLTGITFFRDSLPSEYSATFWVAVFMVWTNGRIHSHGNVPIYKLLTASLQIIKLLSITRLFKLSRVKML